MQMALGRDYHGPQRAYLKLSEALSHGVCLARAGPGEEGAPWLSSNPLFEGRKKLPQNLGEGAREVLLL